MENLDKENLLGIVREETIVLDPKKIKLPGKAISNLNLETTLILQRDYLANTDWYTIFISSPLIRLGRYKLYRNTDKALAGEAYEKILDDFKKGNYAVEAEIQLQVYPATLFGER